MVWDEMGGWGDEGAERKKNKIKGQKENFHLALAKHAKTKRKRI